MKFMIINIIILLGSNHYGIASWYTMKAVEQGLIVNINISLILLTPFQFSSMMQYQLVRIVKYYVLSFKNA